MYQKIKTNHLKLQKQNTSNYLNCIEFKLGNREIEEGAYHLLELKKLIQKANAEKQAKLREPDLLIVITGGEMAYTRIDGVKILPIGTLKP